MADNNRKNQDSAAEGVSPVRPPFKQKRRSAADMLARAETSPWFGIGIGPEEAKKYLKDEE